MAPYVPSAHFSRELRLHTASETEIEGLSGYRTFDIFGSKGARPSFGALYTRLRRTKQPA
jgi:hypothetical protein